MLSVRIERTSTVSETGTLSIELRELFDLIRKSGRWGRDSNSRGTKSPPRFSRPGSLAAPAPHPIMCARMELNHHQKIRNLLFYPLNYKRSRLNFNIFSLK